MDDTKLEKTTEPEIIDVEWIQITDPKYGRGSEIKRILSATPLFEGLNNRDWRELISLCHVRKYQDEEIIFEDGTPGLGAYVILEGTVKIYGERKNQIIELASLGTGAFFGEMSLIDELPRSATGIASGETRLVGLFRPQLRQLLHARPKLGIIIMERLAKMVADRLRISNELIAKYQEQLSRLEKES